MSVAKKRKNPRLPPEERNMWTGFSPKIQRTKREKAKSRERLKEELRKESYGD